MKQVLSVLLLFIFLTGCAAQPTLVSKQLPPTDQAAPAATTESASTPTADPPPTQAPTVDATTTAIVATLLAQVPPRTLATYASPDGQWRAEVLIRDCTQVGSDEGMENAYDLVRVARLSDGATYTAADQLQYCGGVGGSGLGGIVWSPNSRYFYFTNVREGVPDGTGGVGWHRPILRFNTQTQQTEDLGAGLLSPDGKLLASTQYQTDSRTPGGVIIQTVDGDILARFVPENAEQAGWLYYISWAKSSQELVYLETGCQSNNCRSNLYRVDALSGERKTLFQDQQPYFLDVTWYEADRLTLTDQDYHTWYYTFENGLLEEKQDA